jgi:hypothetical protein
MIEFIIAMQNVSDDNETQTAYEATRVDAYIQVISEVAGGCSVIQQRGGWYDSEIEKVVIENSYKFTVYTEKDINNYIVEFAHTEKQKAVYIDGVEVKTN